MLRLLPWNSCNFGGRGALIENPERKSHSPYGGKELPHIFVLGPPNLDGYLKRIEEPESASQRANYKALVFVRVHFVFHFQPLKAFVFGVFGYDSPVHL